MQGRKSSGEEPSQTPQIGDYVPNGSSENVVQASFNGNYEEAMNYYYKEVNKLYFANIVLNNQVPVFLFSSRPSWTIKINSRRN